MKILYISLFLFLSLPGMTQVRDDFSDGNFTKNPAWQGDTTKFEVNSSNQLHLASTGSDTSLLWTKTKWWKQSEWNLWVKLSFNTSANNYARIYLASDTPVIGTYTNAYYLQIGGSNDSLALFKQTGSNHQKLFTGNKSFTGKSTNTLRIKILHDSTNSWHLFTDETGNTNFTEEGVYVESSSFDIKWFGVYCRYTSSNATKFYFDEFYIGPIIIDSIAPSIASFEVLSENQIKLIYSEPIDNETGENPLNYFVPGHGHPVNIFSDSLSPEAFILKFNPPFEDGSYDSLTVKNIEDRAGNMSSAIVIPFSYYNVKAYDIVIDEIMADPSPQVGLPDAEYVELYNRTAFPINLKDWTLIVGSTVKVIPEIILPPFGFLTLAKGDLLSFFGASVNLFTSEYTLTNDGTTIVLKKKLGAVIHALQYSSDWYQNSLKKEGGWSLEMIDTENPCGCIENWTSSTDPLGGTPGRKNSVKGVNPDTLKPYIKRAFIEGNNNVHLVFSETIDTTTIGVAGEWLIEPAEIDVDSIFTSVYVYDQLSLQLNLNCNKGTIYKIFPPATVKDCVGNPMNLDHDIEFAIPDTIIPNDIVINEVLPNPQTGGERFIELLNRSEKVLNLKDVVFLESESQSSNQPDPIELIPTDYLIFPGKYIVLTKSPADVEVRYKTINKEAILGLSSMPSITDEVGELMIARKNDLLIIDKMNYSSDMQYPLLSSTEGVSLERINPEGSSEDKSNWHSASESCGFATPGVKNSQSVTFQNTTDEILIDPPIFTPDNDGTEDLVFIRFHLEKVGYSCNIVIFDNRGRVVKQLVKNDLLSPEGYYTWDGTNEHRFLSPVGIYIAYVNLLGTDGTVKSFKKPIVLGAKN